MKKILKFLSAGFLILTFPGTALALPTKARKARP